MTAQLEASVAYQAIPIPVFSGKTLTAFAVRSRNFGEILHDLDIHNIQAGTYDGRIWSIAGDSYGVLHTFDPSSPEDLLSTPSHVLQHSWTRDYRLDSQVSYVHEYFPNNQSLSTSIHPFGYPQISSIRSSGPRWV